MLSPGRILAMSRQASAGVVFAILAALCHVYAAVGAGLVLAVFVWQAIAITPLPAVLGLGSIWVYPLDVVFAALAVAGLARVVQRGPRTFLRQPQLTWLMFGLLILLAFVRGVAAFGPQAAGVDFRKFFYLFAGVLYFSAFMPVQQRLRRFQDGWLLVAGLLVLLSLVRWAVELLGLPMASAWSSRGSMRVLNSAEALFLAQVLLIMLYGQLGRLRSRQTGRFAMVLFPVVVLLQHRTVWVALFVAIILILLRERVLRRKLLVLVAVGAMVTGAGLLLVFGDGGEALLRNRASNTGTLEWRIEGWRALLAEQATSRVDLFVGRPFGAGYARTLASTGAVVEVSPHNFYVELLLRVGIVGLAVFIWTQIWLLQRFLRSRPGEVVVRHFNPRLLLVLLTVQLVYYLTYSPSSEQGMLMGIMFGVAYAAQEQEIGLRHDLPRRTGGTWKRLA